MDVTQRASLLMRLAQKCPEDRPALLEWAHELLEEEIRRTVGPLREPSRVDPTTEQPIRFPLRVFIQTRDRRIDGILHRDASVEANGKRYGSISRFASDELGYPENGYRKVQYERPDGSFGVIDELRRDGIVGRPLRGRRPRAPVL